MPSDGAVVGRHLGSHRYTVGQRKRLGIAWKHPLHVCGIDSHRNRVVVGGYDELATTSLTADRATWSATPAATEFRATCRIRYRHKPAPCRVVMLDDRRFTVHFDTPQSAVTP